ncbi:GGDEF domain-containing protein [Fusibacter paucivorans]|uniref:GGDEF domain-containing protein n=1 Tax=Fusibacter paucivorans TaxID=76009 RepID=A0ABS5PQL6_9FIRM|nr:GGDEF domain-containing protein [Fusibacter paucivorans]MBS7526337.1 GGDEF domain-containing protein [Fusibacter paucivorans]
MKKLMNRTRSVFIAIMALSLVLGIFGIYKPMKEEVETNVLNNFQLISSTKAATLKEAMNKSIQGTRSLSSRTMIKQELVAYQNGAITFDALKTFTQDKYADGVGALENVMYAQRIVDQTVLCEVVNDGYVGNTVPLATVKEALAYYLEDREGKTCLEVVSPIIEDGKTMGYDRVGFCLNDIVALLNQGNVHFEIGERRNDLNLVVGHENLYEDDFNYYQVVQIDDQTVVYSYASKKELFKRVEMITRRSAVYVVVGYGLMLLLVHFSIIVYARRQIEKISADRDGYKIRAYRDSLTDAYSRLYFEMYVSEHLDDACILCMLDLDHFKAINDQYGHAIGDAVLKTFVETVKQSIQEDDLVIRYGGDEFIIIFKQLDMAVVTERVEHIKVLLSAIQTFEFEIDFSYGIAEVPVIRQIYDQIKAADQEMYHDKRKKAI